MRLDGWLVVETLASEGTRTVVVDGDKTRNWSSLGRARSGMGADISGRMASVVESCVETGVVQESVIAARPGRQSLKVLGVPVCAAFGRVHAVHVWAGPADQTPADRRFVYAWDWDADAELAYNGPGLESHLLGLPPDRQKVVRTPSENMSGIERFDDRVGYIGLCTDPHGGGKWQGEVTIRDAAGALNRVQMIARASTPGHPKVIHGLFHVITDVRPPEPMLETSVLRAVARASGEGVALIALELAVAYDWLSAPASPLNIWTERQPDIHPDDAYLLPDECRMVSRTGEPRQFTMRVRFSGSDWITTHVSLVRVSDDIAPHGLMTVKPVIDS